MDTRPPTSCFIFFFNDTATTEIYTLSLHDALPISPPANRGPSREEEIDVRAHARGQFAELIRRRPQVPQAIERSESTRLNSSHVRISYAVFCLKKKKRHHRHAEPAPHPADQRHRQA